MTAVGKGRIQRPEDLDDTHRRLRDRLGEVAARRRDRADGGEASLPLVAAEALDHARALVELRQTRGKVSGVAFFAGHLFQTTRHFAQRLRPAGGRVGDNCDGVAHVTEVFGDGDAGVDARLTRRDRHIRGVGDEHRALHQTLTRARVDELGELAQHIGHLVAALAAADVNDEIHVRPLGKRVLHDGLAAAERPRDRCRAALGDREEGIHDALTGLERCNGRVFFHVGPSHAHRPLLDHREFFSLALVRFHDRDRILYGEASRADLLHRAAHVRRQHDLVQDRRRFLHRTEHVAADEVVTNLGNGGEVPLLLAVERGNLLATRQKVAAGLLTNDLQRALNAIVNIFNQAGAKFHGERRAGRYDLRPRAEAGGLFIHLNGGGVAAHRQNLADEVLLTHANHIRHVRFRKSRCHDQRPGDLNDLSHKAVAPFLQNIRTDGLFRCRVYARRADAETSLPAGNEDHGGGQFPAPPLDLRRDLRGKMLGDIDDGVVFLRHAVDGVLCLLAALGDAGIEPESAEAQYAVAPADHSDLIHAASPLRDNSCAASRGCPLRSAPRSYRIKWCARR